MLVTHIKCLLETRLQAERSGARIRVGKEIFSSPKRPDRLWDPPSLHTHTHTHTHTQKTGIRCSFPDKKWPEPEVNH